jgi:hypothetical protein
MLPFAFIQHNNIFWYGGMVAELPFALSFVRKNSGRLLNRRLSVILSITLMYIALHMRTINFWVSNAACMWRVTVWQLTDGFCSLPSAPKMKMIFCNSYESLSGVILIINRFGVKKFFPVGFSSEASHRGSICYFSITWLWKGDILQRMYFNARSIACSVTLTWQRKL